jgi:hypothetical protein
MHPNSDEHRGHGGGTAVLGDGVRVLSSLRALKWVPSQWRYLAPDEDRGGDQSRPGCAIPRRGIPFAGLPPRDVRKRQPLG